MFNIVLSESETVVAQILGLPLCLTCTLFIILVFLGCEILIDVRRRHSIVHRGTDYTRTQEQI